MPSPNANRERSYSGDMMDEGKVAEIVALDFLERHPQIISVDDLRDDPEWQAQDVDFRAHLYDGREWLVDAKSDVHLAGKNMLFEVLRINHTNGDFPVRLGWSVHSSAKSFLIYSPSEQRLYSVLKCELNDAMRRETRSIRSLGNWRFIKTDTIKSTIIILIPKQHIRYSTYECVDGAWLPVQADARTRTAS